MKVGSVRQTSSAFHFPKRKRFMLKLSTVSLTNKVQFSFCCKSWTFCEGDLQQRETATRRLSGCVSVQMVFEDLLRYIYTRNCNHSCQKSQCSCFYLFLFFCGRQNKWFMFNNVLILVPPQKKKKKFESLKAWERK